MNLDLSGKTALITGGAKRIGRSIALALAEHGADVIIHYRSSAAEADALADELRAVGRQAWTMAADLSDSRQVDGVIDNAVGLAGKIDILINNASSFPASTLETVTLEELIESVKIEAWAPLAIGRAFAAKAGKGHIVNILDTRAIGYDWNHAAYHAAKHMLWLFTREMAVRFAPGVAVNGVAPGLILPPAGKDEAYMKALRDRLPLKRIGDPQYIADAVLFLVCSEFITGQVIFVDGGRHLSESCVG